MNRGRLLRNLLIEGVLYAIFAGAYVVVVIRFLSPYFERYFESNLPLYAVASLFFTLLQGLLLEYVTTFLYDRLGLAQLG